MKIKVTLIAALALGGTALSMDNKYFTIVTPIEYFNEVENIQEKHLEKNQNILANIQRKEERDKKDIEIIKENYDFCASIDPQKQTKAFCYICRSHRSDDVTQPWVILKPCGHPYHVNCIAQWGSIATESQARLCQNPQHAGKEKPYTLPKNIQCQLDQDTAFKLMERGILPMNDEEKNSLYWHNVANYYKQIIASGKNAIVAHLKNPVTYAHLYGFIKTIYNIEKFHSITYATLKPNTPENRILVNLFAMKRMIISVPTQIIKCFIDINTPSGICLSLLNALRYYQAYTTGISIAPLLWNDLKENSYTICMHHLFAITYMALRFPGMRNALLNNLKTAVLKNGMRA